MSRRACSVPLVAAALAACGEYGAPCGSDAACTADLALASVAVVAAAHDPVSGLAVVSPEAMDVAFVVRNEGTTRSRATLVSIEMKGRSVGTAPLPALAPNATHAGTLRVQPGFGRFLTVTDTARITAVVVGIEEDISNNAGVTEPFHIALPVLQTETSFDSLRLTVNVAATARVWITNHSRHAALPASTLRLCLYELGALCRGDEDAVIVARVDVPEVGPGEARALDIPVAVPSAAAHQNSIDSYHLSTCIGSAGAPAAALPADATRDCAAPLLVSVRPDYESCNPTLLQVDQPVSASPVCMRPCPIFVFSADVHPGYTYRVERANGSEDTTLRWRTRYRDDVVDVSPEPGLQPATAARVYAVSALRFCSSAAVSREVVLRRTGDGPR